MPFNMASIFQQILERKDIVFDHWSTGFVFKNSVEWLVFSCKNLRINKVSYLLTLTIAPCTGYNHKSS